MKLLVAWWLLILCSLADDVYSVDVMGVLEDGVFVVTTMISMARPWVLQRVSQ